MNSGIASNMERIKTIFQHSQELASQSTSVPDLVLILKKTETEFLPVAFEGAAMAIALKDFSEGDAITNWTEFLDASKTFACHLYIGLGWAVGKERKMDLPFLDALNRNMQFRIWDGCGYYDGIFKHRQVIKGLNRLEHIQPKDHQAYDEGLGRSLWYTCNGEESKIAKIMESFPAKRHSDLWRGIGIACAFVGGFDEPILKKLLIAAGPHSIQLGIGSAMVAKSRIESDCKTEGIELACRIFSNLNADEAMKITIKNKSVPNFSFSTFILQMESDLMKVVDSRQKEKVDN